VNQIELHPYFPQREQRAFNAAAGILTQSWSPLGRANVDVWVDFETADKVGCVLVGPVDAPDLELLKPDKVVVAFDEDHIALAVVVGRVRQGTETATSSGLRPGASRSTSRQSYAVGGP
jgi:hypothetical protein